MSSRLTMTIVHHAKPTGPTTAAVLLLVLFLAPTEARMLHYFSYTTMMGFAAQSVVWKQGMERELTLVSKKSSEASLLQDAAAEDQAAAEEWTEKATTDKDASISLQEETSSKYSNCARSKTM